VAWPVSCYVQGMITRGTSWHSLLALTLAGVLAGCANTDGTKARESTGGKTSSGGSTSGGSGGEESGGDQGSGGNSEGIDSGARCEAKAKAFSDFVAAHRSCSRSEQCTVIGDCGPNADFAAVQAEHAYEAYALQKARCEATWDGPLFSAKCVDGECVLEERVDECCGCSHGDAGP
jgi:hypothetical protein